MQTCVCTKRSYRYSHVSAHICVHVCIHTPVPAHSMLPCMSAWVQAPLHAFRNTRLFVIEILNHPLPLPGTEFPCKNKEIGNS